MDTNKTSVYPEHNNYGFDLIQEGNIMRPETRLTIDRFVAALWEHVCLRAIDGDPNIIATSAKYLKETLGGIGPKEYFEEIGESLSAYILNTTVKTFARESCKTCGNLQDCNEKTSTLCNAYVKDERCIHNSLQLFTNAVVLLDGAYGTNASQLLSVIHRFVAPQQFRPS